MSFLIEILQMALAISLSFLGMEYQRQDNDDTVLFQPVEAHSDSLSEAVLFQGMVVWVEDVDAPMAVPAPVMAPAPRVIAQVKSDTANDCEARAEQAEERVISLSAI